MRTPRSLGKGYRESGEIRGIEAIKLLYHDSNSVAGKTVFYIYSAFSRETRIQLS